jgi:membrane protein DedA with SNARE-associated domain
MLHTHVLIALLHAYGYWALALVVGLESLGLPLPGEGLLIAASLVAGSTHEMNVYLVIAAAALGAIVGQVAGFWIGRSLGIRALRRFGPHIGLPARRLALGRLLFRRHGVALVVVGRFIIVVRTIAALLAGANAMDAWRFMLANVVGSVIWAGAYGIAVSELGKSMKHMAGPIGIAVGVAAALAALVAWLAVRRQERRMLASPARMRRMAATGAPTRTG